MIETTSFVLTTRALTLDDTSRDCQHLLEDNAELELYLSSLAHDIEGLPEITSVSRSGLILHLETKTPMSVSTLDTTIKPFFAGERFCFYRHVSLVAK